MQLGKIVFALILILLIGPTIYWFLRETEIVNEKPLNIYYCEKDKDCVNSNRFSKNVECVNRKFEPEQQPGTLGLYCKCNSIEKKCTAFKPVNPNELY
jgi:hypothetical protein